MKGLTKHQATHSHLYHHHQTQAIQTTLLTLTSSQHHTSLYLTCYCTKLTTAYYRSHKLHSNTLNIYNRVTSLYQSLTLCVRQLSNSHLLALCAKLLKLLLFTENSWIYWPCEPALLLILFTDFIHGYLAL